MAEAPGPGEVSARLDAIFRAERGRILATLIAILRDFELAEESLQEAVGSALMAWPRDGVPQNPRAWLVQTAKNRAIDRLRRDGTLARTLAALPAPDRTQSIEALLAATGPLADDRLRLLFTCCHPALAPGSAGGAGPSVCSVVSRRPRSPAPSSFPEVTHGSAHRSGQEQDPRCKRFPIGYPSSAEPPERLRGVLAA